MHEAQHEDTDSDRLGLVWRASCRRRHKRDTLCGGRDSGRKGCSWLTHRPEAATGKMGVRGTEPPNAEQKHNRGYYGKGSVRVSLL